MRRSSGSRGGPSRSRSAIGGRRPTPSPIGSPRRSRRPSRPTPTPATSWPSCPGVEEIRRAGRQLAPWAAARGVVVLPLHGSLPAEEQDRALRPSDRRKVILATNIAETSLTIDGVATVIDGGLARFASHDPARGLDRLELGRISRASADQRAGRAGRTRPGRCVRLWSEREQRGLAESDVARGPPRRPRRDRPRPPRLGPRRPRPVRLVRGPRRRVARRRRAAPGHARGPRRGRGGDHAARPAAARRPRPPPARPAPDRVGADRGCSAKGPRSPPCSRRRTSCARSFGRDARPEVHAESDLLVRLDRLDEAERARFAPGLRDRGIDPAAARQVARVRDDLLRVARRLPGPGIGRTEPDEDDAPPAGPAGLPRPGRPPAGRRRLDRRDGRRPGGPARPRVGRPRRRVLPRPRPAGGPPGRDARGPGPDRQRHPARMARRALPGLVRRERSVRVRRGAAAGRRRLDPRLSRPRRSAKTGTPRSTPRRPAGPWPRPWPPRAATFFERGRGRRPPGWPGSTSPAGRCPRPTGPTSSEADWAELIALACLGKRSEDEVPAGRCSRSSRAGSSYRPDPAARRAGPRGPDGPQRQPDPPRLPGRRPAGPGRPAPGAVRLDRDAPDRRGPGRRSSSTCSGPNYRPVQITDDLRSFWATAYFQVRKDLRARYPKHSWPDDPLTARPEARGGRRRT